jgi:chaperonin GroES
MEGKVVAAGPGKIDQKGQRIAMELRTGDRVLFSKYAGTEIKVDGVDHLFMRQDDILGVIE